MVRLVGSAIVYVSVRGPAVISRLMPVIVTESPTTLIEKLV
jgi:hypothetical protein